jgi:hypothetical protein
MRKGVLAVTLVILALLALAVPLLLVKPAIATGATTSVHIVRYAPDGTTVLSEKTVDYKWMEGNLPVQGDGVTHYYHQGPVFQGDMWDPEETVNLKDKGAVMGTDVKDLCELVGGMSPGDEISLCAVDGYCVKFAYDNVYEPLYRQGPIVLCWYKGDDGSGYGAGYPGNDAFSEAMQIVFFANNTNSEGKHVFGNSDMKVSLPEEKYQHFYQGLPSTNGLSGKWISEIRIYPADAPVNIGEGAIHAGASEASNSFPWLPVVLGVAGLLAVGSGIYLLYLRKAKSADRTQ